LDPHHCRRSWRGRGNTGLPTATSTSAAPTHTPTPTPTPPSGWFPTHIAPPPPHVYTAAVLARGGRVVPHHHCGPVYAATDGRFARRLPHPLPTLPYLLLMPTRTPPRWSPPPGGLRCGGCIRRVTTYAYYLPTYQVSFICAAPIILSTFALSARRTPHRTRTTTHTHAPRCTHHAHATCRTHTPHAHRTPHHGILPRAGPSLLHHVSRHRPLPVATCRVCRASLWLLASALAHRALARSHAALAARTTTYFPPAHRAGFPCLLARCRARRSHSRLRYTPRCRKRAHRHTAPVPTFHPSCPAWLTTHSITYTRTPAPVLMEVRQFFSFHLPTIPLHYHPSVLCSLCLSAPATPPATTCPSGVAVRCLQQACAGM